MINTILVDCPSWVLSLRPDLHLAEQGLQSLQLFCDWGRQIKAYFCISGNTIVQRKLRLSKAMLKNG
jgi:hypothetical protein